MKQIEVLISPDGQSRILSKGYSGGLCRDATRELEQALGDRHSEQLTAEFYQTTSQQSNQHHERQ